MDEATISSRITQLDAIVSSTKYSKTKSALQVQLERFLASLNPRKSLSSALPADIRKFLIWKDDFGKTKVHTDNCTFMGSFGSDSCQCPLRRSHKSVDALIGQIRAIFRDNGRAGEWNDASLLGNPASAQCIKKHLKAVQLEQGKALVHVKKAVPLYLDKILKLSRYLKYQVNITSSSPMKQLLYMRDRAFILIMAHSGDRAGDLGQVSAKQIFWLQDKQGLLFCLTMGKTLQGKSTRKFVVLRSTDVNICPVQALIEFRDGLLKLGFCKARYLFSPVNPSMSAFLDKPLSSAVVCNRLKDHLSSVGLWEGETSYGARSACAILLQTLGVSNEGIKRHVGWNTDAMLKEYTSVSNMWSQENCSARILSDAASRKGISQDDNVFSTSVDLRDSYDVRNLQIFSTELA